MFIFIILFNKSDSFGQGSFIEVNTGTLGYAGLSVGHQITKNEFGVTYFPTVYKNASFLGLFYKRKLGKYDSDFMPFIGMRAGQINRPDDLYGDLTNLNNINFPRISYKKENGYSIIGGFDFSSGGHYSYNAELGLGKMPNLFNAILPGFDPYRSNADNFKRFTTIYHLTFGIKYYFKTSKYTPKPTVVLG
jgi:hypothetical protein